MTERRGARAVLVSLCAVVLLGACGDAGETGDTAGDTQETAPSEEGAVTEDPSPASPAPGAGTPQAGQAVADLARRLDVPEDEVTVVSVEAVTWNDGSLGCAKKDTAYTQALVEGTRITLRAEGRTFEYHAAGRRVPFYCAEPTQ